jgi:hypothetical protein
MLALPRRMHRMRLGSILRGLDARNHEAILDRVNYYNKLSSPFPLGPEAQPFRMSLLERRRNYRMDLFATMRYFDPALRVHAIFGDIRHVPESPAIVKARPVEGDNANSILFKLNKIRHFVFVDDPVPFESKKDRLVWRGNAYQPNRRKFLEQFFGHAMCDVGHAEKRLGGKPWQVPYLTIGQQLENKFVLSMEGNDVATNLKWILSSNSLCFMTRPKLETWFMEGRLVPGRHYVLLREDYSDLVDKMLYYASHVPEALGIIDHAHRHVAQFRDRATEDLVSVLVLRKYFDLSGQGGEDGAWMSLYRS